MSSSIPSYRVRVARLLLALGLAAHGVGCRSKDDGTMERVALLEAEVEQRDSELEKLRKAAATAEAAVAERAKGPNLAAARSTYHAEAENFGAALSKILTEANIGRAAISEVEEADPHLPIHSSVVYSVTLSGGRQIELPVATLADPLGHWVFPSANETAAQFRKSVAASAPLPVQPQPQPVAQKPAATPSKPSPVDVMASDKTVQVQWDDQKPRPAAQQNRPSPQAPGAPPTPKKVMPADRDVIIDFKDR